jgi:hypothetical protein
VLWPAVFAVLGVVIGCGAALVVVSLTEHRRTLREEEQAAADRKRELYVRTLTAVDDLLSMRDDHPDFALAARTLTTAIVELELLAPRELGELADHCATLVLRRPGNAIDAAHARAQFAAAARQDLAVVVPPRARMVRAVGGRHARHSVAGVGAPSNGRLVGSVNPGLR